MQNYHEPPSELSDETRDKIRALVSLREEIEAIDWYQQRLDVTNDQQLKKILKHNRDEEIEHACMALEWLRRNDKVWDEKMNTYLFTEKDIVKLEDD
jgi:ferritin-like protein